MKVRIAIVALGCLAFAWIGAVSLAHVGQEALLDVARGQIPNDTGSDGATRMSIEQCPALDGQALKVAFASGDSFGDRTARIKDWRPYKAMEFNAYNPADSEVRLALTVRHKGSTGYPTRVDVPLTLKPGKNSVSLRLEKLTNVNGSAPDWSEVGKWYIACEQGHTPTVFFSSIRLLGTGAAGAADTAEMAENSEGETRSGKTAAPAKSRLAGDPARLARIREATMPSIPRPVMFNTPAADALCTALEVYPADNAWNAVVEHWPVHPNSQAIVASIGADKPLRYNPDMGFILVPPDQERVAVKIADYPDESDRGPYPVPDNVPIEGWPVGFTGAAERSLDDVQRDKFNRGGDRHAIVVDPVSRVLYEFYQMRKTDGGWQCAQASIFDLKTNKLRPDGWTSADAAGLPIFPAVVRYDELQRGLVEHAMRVTVRRSRRAYVAPATHYASRLTAENLPRMGERIRLRQDYDVSGFSPPVQAILKGLKKYGMLVADNGLEWAISVAPDPRIPNLHADLRKVKGSAFEVVVAP